MREDQGSSTSDLDQMMQIDLMKKIAHCVEHRIEIKIISKFSYNDTSEMA